MFLNLFVGCVSIGCFGTNIVFLRIVRVYMFWKLIDVHEYLFSIRMTSLAPPIHWSVAVFRRFSTSRARNVSASPSVIKEIGRLAPPTQDVVYQPGQMFIHRTFAYKGLIVCAFNCKFHEKKEVEGAAAKETISLSRDYYQVLVHRPDWPYMMFPVDLTCYLQEGSTPRGEKLLAMINGMDCVSHADVMPYTSSEKNPIDHDLFERIFTREETEDGTMKMTMRPTLLDNYMASQRSWLAPRDVYREVTEAIEVTVMTFYLGSNMVAGQLRHTWRYVVRIENHAPQNSVILRERTLKIYSLHNMNQANGHGVVGKQPELNLQSPAFQFSSTVELPHAKGGHMWGTFKMERENGSTFSVTIPTVTLESLDDKVIEATEKISE